MYRGQQVRRQLKKHLFLSATHLESTLPQSVPTESLMREAGEVSVAKVERQRMWKITCSFSCCCPPTADPSALHCFRCRTSTECSNRTYPSQHPSKEERKRKKKGKRRNGGRE